MTSLVLLKSMLFANCVLQKNKRRKKSKPKKKAIKKITTGQICRVCTKQEGVIPIFNNLIQSNISEEITNFSGITISVSDNFSKHLCQSCLDLLNSCIKFRDMCQKSNELLANEPTIKKETNWLEEATGVVPCDSDDDLSYWGCTNCRKDFYDRDAYNNHLDKCIAKKTERDKKKFLCDICGKITGSNANLSIHKKTHEDIFPFKCDQCPYQGRTVDLLKVHKRTHMVDKPYKCTQCPKTASTASNLAKHMRNKHTNDKLNKPFQCTYCEKAFSYQNDVKRHVKDIHLRQGSVECDLCQKKFNTKKILHEHKWKVHKIKSGRHGRLPSYLQCQKEITVPRLQKYETMD